MGKNTVPFEAYLRMYACMYVCIYACMYVCMYMCTLVGVKPVSFIPDVMTSDRGALFDNPT
jgi:hypothetical protein